MPVVTRLRPAPSRRPRRRFGLARPPLDGRRPSAARSRRRSAPYRRAPPAPGRCRPAAPSVTRMWLGASSNVRTTMPPAAAAARSRRSARPGRRTGSSCATRARPARPRRAAVIRVRSATVSATIAHLVRLGQRHLGDAAECEEMLPGGRIASSFAASAGGARISRPARRRRNALTGCARPPCSPARTRRERSVPPNSTYAWSITTSPSRGSAASWAVGAGRVVGGADPVQPGAGGIVESTPPASRVAFSNIA